MPNSANASQSDQQLGLIFQYTVEAYKTYAKLGENLPNPMAASLFRAMANEERGIRDLLEIKYLRGENTQVTLTLAGDLRFQDIIEGDLSYREIAELLIARESTMEKRLLEMAQSAGETDRNLLRYIAYGKRAHVVLFERELELIKQYPDWFKLEDAEALIVHGETYLQSQK